jgi:peptide-methionine (S)-S-oxide reductase
MKKSNFLSVRASGFSSSAMFAQLLVAAIGIFYSVAVACQQPAQAAETKKLAAAPKVESGATRNEHLQKAIFAAGCFWGVEDTFRHLPGVVDAFSGFTGGNAKNPSYELVCTGKTHHAEAVEVLYDPNKVTYQKLLDTFWNMHDPTTLNSQGPDFGEQYRSAIFYLNNEQKKEAEASRDKLATAKTYKNPIVTQIVPAGDFYKAEDYHQHYFEKHPDVAACHKR